MALEGKKIFAIAILGFLFILPASADTFYYNNSGQNNLNNIGNVTFNNNYTNTTGGNASLPIDLSNSSQVIGLLPFSFISGYSDNDPFILLTSEGILNVNHSNSTTYWAGLTAPDPLWSSLGRNGNNLTLTSVTDNGDYTYTWHYSDGNSSTTGNLRGGTGAKGDKGDIGTTGTNGTNATFNSSWCGANLTCGDTTIDDTRSNYQNKTVADSKATWDIITSKTTLSEVNNSALLQSINQILGLDTALSGKQASGDYATNTALTNANNSMKGYVDASNTSMKGYVDSGLSGKMNTFTTWAGLANTDTGATQTWVNNYGYLLTATYSGNFPNSTLAGYGGNFPNTSLPNYLLTATYGTDFPNLTSVTANNTANTANTTANNAVPISLYSGNFPNSTVAGNLAAWNATYNSTYNATTSTVNANLANWNATYNVTYDVKVSSVTATNPISSSGGTSPNISITRQIPIFQLGNVSTCSRNTAANGMAGLNINYTTSANTTGTIFATLDFQITAPATVSLTTKYQVAYGYGTKPNCNAAATGTTVGQQYTYYNPSALANQQQVELTFAISGRPASNKTWIDVQATDSTTGIWIYSLPQLTVIEQ